MTDRDIAQKMYEAHRRELEIAGTDAPRWIELDSLAQYAWEAAARVAFKICEEAINDAMTRMERARSSSVSP